jgi:succinate dehydrogenase / fumarate reductase cytochrome b subunit
MLLSITHRITGVGLAMGGVLLVWWLMALASGPEYFALVQALLASSIGRLMLLGWTWAMFYHLCNGIRHLCWDAGWGFELDTARNTGLLVLAGSILLTVGSWMAIYAMRGA